MQKQIEWPGYNWIGEIANGEKGERVNIYGID